MTRRPGRGRTGRERALPAAGLCACPGLRLGVAGQGLRCCLSRSSLHAAVWSLQRVPQQTGPGVAPGSGGVAVLTAVEQRAASTPRCSRGTGPPFPEVRQQLGAGGSLRAGHGPGFGLVSSDGRARAGAERRSRCLPCHPESPGWHLGQALQRESAVREGPASQTHCPAPHRAPRSRHPVRMVERPQRHGCGSVREQCCVAARAPVDLIPHWCGVSSRALASAAGKDALPGPKRVPSILRPLLWAPHTGDREMTLLIRGKSGQGGIHLDSRGSLGIFSVPGDSSKWVKQHPWPGRHGSQELRPHKDKGLVSSSSK